MAKFVDKEIARICALVSENGQVLGAVSGGVDSTVAAKLMHEAISDHLHENGCMRLKECEQVKKTLTEHLVINLTVVGASDLFFDGLKGIHDKPEGERKFVGSTFIDVSDAEALKIEEAAKNSSQVGQIEWFLQRTLYPDAVESISFQGPSATIKKHTASADSPNA
jgi:GMP synthase (glutamine-hydrolysing)